MSARASAARASHGNLRYLQRGDARARPAVLFSADFTTLPAGAVGSMPSGLLFSRASSGGSIQSGASAVLTLGGFTSNDVARAGRRLDAHDVGLWLERQATNYVPDSRAITGGVWASSGGAVTSNVGAGPDGVANADRQTCASGAFGNYATLAAFAGTRTYSVWGRQHAGTGRFQISYGTGSPSAAEMDGTLSSTTAWARYRVTATNAVSTLRYPAPLEGRVGVVPAGALDVWVDMHQVEDGSFPGSYIPTAGATATRAGERLYHPTAAELFHAGRLNHHMKLRPLGAAAGYASAYYLGQYDANNCARINSATRRLEVLRGGVTVYNPPEALAFAENDLLEIQYAAGGGIQSFAKYKVNGGGWTNLTADAPVGAFAPSGAWDWLCSGTANQFSAQVYQLEALRGDVVLS